MKRTTNKSIRSLIFNKYNGYCAYCGCKLDINNFNIDHIKPLMRKMQSNDKGNDKVENYNPSCIACNCSKSTFQLEQWRENIKLRVKKINNETASYSLLKRFGLIQEINSPVIFYFEKIHQHE